MTLIVYSIMKIYSDDHNTLQNFILIDKFTAVRNEKTNKMNLF